MSVNPLLLNALEYHAEVSLHTPAHLSGSYHLLACLMYGAGLRLMEAVTLRVKDVDFECNQLTVRGEKGDKDCVTMLPQSLKSIKDLSGPDCRRKLRSGSTRLADLRKALRVDKQAAFSHLAKRSQ